MFYRKCKGVTLLQRPHIRWGAKIKQKRAWRARCLVCGAIFKWHY